MPKLKKSLTTKNRTKEYEEIISRELERMIFNWLKRKRIPITEAAEYSTNFIINFAFHALEPREANILISKATSRELIHSGEINKDETMLH